MKNEDQCIIVGLIVGILVGGAIVFTALVLPRDSEVNKLTDKINKFQQTAVDKNYATWSITNNGTGQAEFIWK